MKEDVAYLNFSSGVEDATSNKNHPKLRKLAEILMEFFSDPTKSESKVIVFSQFRNSATEIKQYLDTKTECLVKSEIFVGQNNGAAGQKGLSQKLQ